MSEGCIGYTDLRNNQRAIAPLGKVRQIATVTSGMISDMIKAGQAQLETPAGLESLVAHMVGDNSSEGREEAREARKQQADAWAQRAKRYQGAEYALDLDHENFMVVGLEYFETIPLGILWLKQ
jgi:hypothetical protein